MNEKYHINDKGEVKTCNANINDCRFSKDGHFDNRESALKEIEVMNKNNEFTVFSKLTRTQVDPDSIDLLREKHGRDGGVFYFLNDPQGKLACAAKVYENHDGYKVSLCDIETQSENRGKGYAKALLKRISQEYDVESVPHSGGFTDNGLKYISHLVDRPDEAGKAEADFSQEDDETEYSFIENWNEWSPKLVE